MRTLTDSQTADGNAPATANLWLVLLTIEHADLAAPIRLVNDKADLVSRGDTYEALAFEIQLPDEEEGRLPGCQVRIDNTDLSILPQLRALSGSQATVTAEVVRRHEPDTVLATFSLELASLEYDAGVMNLSLVHEPIIDEPWPGLTYTPVNFPGMFE